MARKQPKSQSKGSAGPNKADSKASGADPFPVVGIGASAGGLEALDELLDHVPAETGIAFVVVTHQHPGHTSLLPELLGKHTKMPVEQATDGVRLQPNHVYVAPPSSNLAILNGRLQLMEPEIVKPGKPKLPIDSFFRSLAADREHRAICIVLSGTGTDGTIGLKAIKAASGMAMVQKAETAKYAGMPSSAMATGLVDYVLPVAEMPAQLVAYANGPYLRGGSPPALKALPPETMQKIYLLLRNRTGHDFSNYKSSTIQRRIERRMNVHQIDTPRNYVAFLQENPSEIDLLFKELLISVTNFFRDPPAFEALAKHLTVMLKSRLDNDKVRIWVPGCATGEEVYSIAILIRECMDEMNRRFDVQIFGTDLDNDAIEAARLGMYPDGIAGDVSSARLERYFFHEDSAYRICKEIREMAVFAPQNVIKDPPFTKLDLISCRNLLIYLDSDLQKRLLPIFHYGLKPDGLLFLGPSESIGTFEDRLETVDKKWKIFRRKDVAVAAYSLPEIPAAQPPEDKQIQGKRATTQPSENPVKTPKQLSTVIERCLLDELCPASVVANERGDVVYVHGHTGQFLELAKGLAGTNVLNMARPGLRHELASAIRRVAGGAGQVEKRNLRVKTNGDHVVVDISVKKITDPESIRGLLMISFMPTVNDGRVAGHKILSDSLIHVDDLVRALIAVAEGGKRLSKSSLNDAQGIYFASHHETFTYAGLGKLVGKSLGRNRTRILRIAKPCMWAFAAINEIRARINGSPEFVNLDKCREAFAGSWACSSAKLQDETGFELTTTMLTRLQQTADWYRNHGWLRQGRHGHPEKPLRIPAR